MKVRHAMAVIAMTTALYSQSLEVRYTDPPFENDRTLAGTVKNISGSNILDDIDVVVFVFGDRGRFLGVGRDTIRGPIPKRSSTQFYINVNHDGSSISKYFLQFDVANSSLRYQVSGGPKSTRLSEASSSVQRLSMTSENCKLLIIGMAESLSASKLRLAARVRNISNKKIWGHIGARITFFDRNGSYLGEDTWRFFRSSHSGHYFVPNAEKALDINISTVPEGSITYQLDFVDSSGITVAHCSK